MSANAGPKDQRALEARPDVLVYTSAVLDHDLEVIGPVQAELFVQSSLEHTDFFARLCDVDPSGKSINISDALVRLIPGRPLREPDGTLRACMDLWPTAYRFKRGHRIRVQVSSGAHPRWARNPGSGEPLATAQTLCAADQTVFHDPAHPSAIILPVQT
jgi:putative CocE/NonD family hydrolase